MTKKLYPWYCEKCKKGKGIKVKIEKKLGYEKLMMICPDCGKYQIAKRKIIKKG